MVTGLFGLNNMKYPIPAYTCILQLQHVADIRDYKSDLLKRKFDSIESLQTNAIEP